MASSHRQAHQRILNSAGCCCKRAKSSRCKPAHAMCSGQNRPPLQRSARLQSTDSPDCRTHRHERGHFGFWQVSSGGSGSQRSPAPFTLLRVKCLLCEPSASSFMHTQASWHGGVAGTGLTNTLWRGSSQEWDGRQSANGSALKTNTQEIGIKEPRLWVFWCTSGIM